MFNYHVGHLGYGSCNHVNKLVGLPSVQPKWLKRFNSYSSGECSFAEDGNTVYFYSNSDQSGYYYLNKFAAKTGDIDFIVEVPNTDMSYPSDLRLANNGVVFNRHYVQLTSKPVKLLDLGQIAVDKGYEHQGMLTTAGSRYISYCLLDRDENGSNHLIYDTETGNCDVHKIPIISAKQVPDSPYLFGVRERGDKHHVICYDIEQGIVWETDTPYVNFVNVGEFVFQHTANHAIAYERNTGEVLHEITNFDGIFNNAPGSVSYAPDTIAMIQNKQLYVFSWLTNQLLFKIEGQYIREVTGAGDILFCHRGRTDDHLNDWIITAYDRYSGEVLWEIDDDYWKWGDMTIVDNHLLAEDATTGGGIACWELGEPYISPHRPK